MNVVDGQCPGSQLMGERRQGMWTFPLEPKIVETGLYVQRWRQSGKCFWCLLVKTTYLQHAGLVSYHIRTVSPVALMCVTTDMYLVTTVESDEWVCLHHVCAYCMSMCKVTAIPETISQYPLNQRTLFYFFFILGINCCLFATDLTVNS